MRDRPDAAPTCPPIDPAPATSSFKSPPVGARRCSVAQLASLRAACFAQDTAEHTACAAFGQANADCLSCAFSTSDAPGWGPLVAFQLPAEVDFANVGGCIAALDPSSQRCAESVQNQLQCLLASCGTCAVASADAFDERRRSIDDLNACFDAANAGPCAESAAMANACIVSASSGPAARCTTMNDDLDSLFSVMGTMCGGL